MERKTILSSVCKLLQKYDIQEINFESMPLHCMIFWLPRYNNCLLDLEMYGVWGYLFVEKS